MAHGKKFTAAEKHFLKKEKQYQDKIKQLEIYIKQKSIDKQKYDEQILSLQSENTQLKDWVNRLLEYTELSKEDIKSTCEKDKNISEAFKILNTFSGGILNM